MTEPVADARYFARILEIVDEELGRPGLRLGPATLARETPGWDSVTMVNILFAVEAVFGVEFTSAQMERVDGVPDLIRIVEEALAPERAPA